MSLNIRISAYFLVISFSVLSNGNVYHIFTVRILPLKVQMKNLEKMVTITTNVYMCRLEGLTYEQCEYSMPTSMGIKMVNLNLHSCHVLKV